MNKNELVQFILADRKFIPNHTAEAFAPTNIALIKYWGKRNAALNLPVTDSLSVSLAHKGAHTHIEIINSAQDEFLLNDKKLDLDSSFSLRLKEFLDLFRFKKEHYRIKTKTNIPVAAGLASSACGFAALTLALNKLYNWELNATQLSILARLGSGSACRSIYSGFVWWQKGIDENGLDSYAIPLEQRWPELCIGLLIINNKAKALSSRLAMEQTLKTSYLYEMWPQQVAHDLNAIHESILSKDFEQFAKISEHNALSMHATMLSAWPPILYAQAETTQLMHKIWELRKQGLSIYFTQDAGPNLKLIFLEKDSASVKEHFPEIEIIKPF